MKPRGPIQGAVFHGGAEATLTPAAHRAYTREDRVEWGMGSLMGLYAFHVADECGITTLGIGFETRDECERTALLTIARLWPDGAASLTKNDPRAAEIFQGALRGVTYPLHLALTPFQERVLCATCTIPCGEVRTYAWVAREIGAPKATRAVANALHNNPAALVVPCHRVVPTAGGIGGYACGTALKEKLLRAEGAVLL